MGVAARSSTNVRDWYEIQRSIADVLVRTLEIVNVNVFRNRCQKQPRGHLVGKIPGPRRLALPQRGRRIVVTLVFQCQSDPCWQRVLFSGR